ncbi:MAG: cytochrome c3 family protein [Thermoanaerobaculia bacterium]
MRALILLGVLVLLAVGVAVSLAPGPITQPIAFNHRLHVEDLGSECTDCHLYAETGVRATIPNLEVCADCHEEAQTESAAEALLVEHIQTNDPIPWRQIYWVPDHVLFSHRRHTAIGGIECETCHGAMGDREKPVTRQVIRLSMNRCMKCHDESGVSNDCLLCHR